MSNICIAHSSKSTNIGMLSDLSLMYIHLQNRNLNIGWSQGLKLLFHFVYMVLTERIVDVIYITPICCQQLFSAMFRSRQEWYMNKPLSKNLKTRILLIYNISTFCCLFCWDVYFQGSNQEESIIWFKVTVFYFDACQWSHIPINLRACTTNTKQPNQRQENMTRGIPPSTPPVQWLEMKRDRCVFCVSKY